MIRGGLELDVAEVRELAPDTTLTSLISIGPADIPPELIQARTVQATPGTTGSRVTDDLRPCLGLDSE